MPGRKQIVKLPPDVMEAYLDLSKDCIAICNIDGRLEYCNPANKEVFGYGPEDLCGLHFSELPFLLNNQSREVKKLFKAVIESGEIDPVEIQVQRRDGQKIWIEVNTTLLKREGKAFALQTVSRDISGRKKQEAALLEYRNFEQLLSGISSKFISMPDTDIDKVIHNALGKVSKFIGAKRAGIFLISDDHRRLQRKYQWTAGPSYNDQGLGEDIPVETFTYAPIVLQRLEDYVVSRPSDLPDEAAGEKKWIDEQGFHPVMILPIISDNEMVGTLGFIGEHGKEHDWPVQYSSLIRYLGTLLYSALLRKDIYQKLRLAQFTLERYTDGVFWIREDFSLYDVNAGACELLGYTRDELTRMSVMDFDTSLDLDDIRKIWSEVQEKGFKRFESILRKKDGETFSADIMSNHIEFEGQLAMVAFAHDISARKRNEELIRESEREFRKIFDNVVDVFFEASLDGKMVNVTPSVERLTKYKREELIGRPMVDFYYDTSVREPMLKELHNRGFLTDHEIEIKDKDGSPIPASLSSRVILDEEGKSQSIVGSISDITHKKKAEIQIRQLSTALEQSPSPVIITDTESNILFVNNSFSAFSGMKPEEVIGSKPDSITRGQINMSGNKKMWKTIRSGKIFRDEIPYSFHDGKKYWLSVTVSPVLDEKVKVTHYVIIFEDITSRKEYEDSLRTAKERAEESDRLKSAFLANMSHEIRTPMNAILGFSSLLKGQEVNPEQRSYYIDIINSKGKDLLRIISDIIDISRIEAGDLYIRTEPVEIFRFVREIYEELKADAQLKTRANLQFRLNIPPDDKSLIINTDSTRLKQVFVNLIQNAIKFTPDGFIEMGFKLLDNNDIRLFVRDSGIGIPKEKQEIIFDRFRQVDDSHTRQYGGTGLGLAICMSLVEKMGGELKVRSGDGQGSEFHFTLKYILTEAPEPAKEVHEKDDASLNLKGKKILIVEDDGSSYIFLETLLQKYHPVISWAKNGKQALAQMEKAGDFDMILMDIRMPQMNGLEATVGIRKNIRISPSLPRLPMHRCRTGKPHSKADAMSIFPNPSVPLN